MARKKESAAKAAAVLEALEKRRQEKIEAERKAREAEAERAKAEEAERRAERAKAAEKAKAEAEKAKADEAERRREKVKRDLETKGKRLDLLDESVGAMFELMKAAEEFAAKINAGTITPPRFCMWDVDRVTLADLPDFTRGVLDDLIGEKNETEEEIKKLKQEAADMAAKD